MARFILIAGIFFSCVACHSNQTDNYNGTDYRLFKNTPIWELAQAVQEQNTESIKKLVTEQKQDLNYQEPKYGSTLLMLTIINDHLRSFETLLQLGANVNLHDSYSGTSALIIAADSDNSDAETFIRLLIQHGADPNDVEPGPRREGNTTRFSPLLAACEDVSNSVNTLEKVKILVDAGANVNYRNEFGASALKTAAVFDHYDVVLYLLEKGAEINTVFYVYNGQETYLWQQLRLSLFPIESEKYQQKMKVVRFLEEHDIDYRSIPIPESAIEQAKQLYPSNWQNYLDSY